MHMTRGWTGLRTAVIALGTIAWTAVGTFIILMICRFTTGLRVSEEGEREGLDITQHGESIE